MVRLISSCSLLFHIIFGENCVGGVSASTTTTTTNTASAGRKGRKRGGLLDTTPNSLFAELVSIRETHSIWPDQNQFQNINSKDDSYYYYTRLFLRGGAGEKRDVDDETENEESKSEEIILSRGEETTSSSSESSSVLETSRLLAGSLISSLFQSYNDVKAEASRVIREQQGPAAIDENDDEETLVSAQRGGAFVRMAPSKRRIQWLAPLDTSRVAPLSSRLIVEEELFQERKKKEQPDDSAVKRSWHNDTEQNHNEQQKKGQESFDENIETPVRPQESAEIITKPANIKPEQHSSISKGSQKISSSSSKNRNESFKEHKSRQNQQVHRESVKKQHLDQVDAIKPEEMTIDDELTITDDNDNEEEDRKREYEKKDKELSEEEAFEAELAEVQQRGQDHFLKVLLPAVAQSDYDQSVDEVTPFTSSGYVSNASSHVRFLICFLCTD